MADVRRREVLDVHLLAVDDGHYLELFQVQRRGILLSDRLVDGPRRGRVIRIRGWPGRSQRRTRPRRRLRGQHSRRKAETKHTTGQAISKELRAAAKRTSSNPR